MNLIQEVHGLHLVTLKSDYHCSKRRVGPNEQIEELKTLTEGLCEERAREAEHQHIWELRDYRICAAVK